MEEPWKSQAPVDLMPCNELTFEPRPGDLEEEICRRLRNQAERSKLAGMQAVSIAPTRDPHIV